MARATPIVHKSCEAGTPGSQEAGNLRRSTLVFCVGLTWVGDG